jgi:hypothetical protein
MARLEGAIARPVASDDWLAEVDSGMKAVTNGLQAHIQEVEGPEGIIADIVDVAPRLSAAATELANEHHGITAAMRRAETALEAARRGGATEKTLLRRRVTTLLGRLTIHRQHGSDLVYDAYNIDIEAGD